MESEPEMAPGVASTSSVAESGNIQSEDEALQEEIAQWKERITTLRNNENFEDKVVVTNQVSTLNFTADSYTPF